MKRNSKLKILLAVLLSFAQVSCGDNFLMIGSEQDTNDANIYEAKLRIDKQQYTEAITYLNGIDSTGQATTEVKMLYVSAYAGLCGMEFIPLFTSIGAANFGGTDGFLKIMMASMVDRTSDADSCMLAYKKLLSVGSTYSLRQTAADGVEPNMVMALVGLVQAGGVLRSKADTDNSGTKDASFNVCTGLTDDEVKSVGIGVYYFVENIAALFTSTTPPSAVTGLATVISAFCSNAPSKCFLGADDFTDISTTNGWTAGEVAEYVDTWKDLIQSPTTGIDETAAVCVGDACCP